VIELAANCSTLFRDVPFEARFARARAAGFRLVESWWPFPDPAPSEAEVARLARALADAEVAVACMNLYAGDLGAGERGIANDPNRVPEFRAGVAAAAAVSAATGCRRFNALYGLEPDPPSPAWDACARANLAFACEALAAAGATLVIEPLCRNPRYGLRTAEAALELVGELRRAGHANAALLADLYQLTHVVDDVAGFIRAHVADIGHVQVADDPGRGAPGTGQAPVLDWLAALADSGYEGAVGLEYLEIPGVPSFDWVALWRNA
jgi:hydroxypyruvate isomerase